MSQKMCFGIICINFAERVENLTFSSIFRKKIREIHYSHNVKTSIGNNPGSIKDRVVKFAYSRGFSEIADRMV